MLSWSWPCCSLSVRRSLFHLPTLGYRWEQTIVDYLLGTSPRRWKKDLVVGGIDSLALVEEWFLQTRFCLKFQLCISFFKMPKGVWKIWVRIKGAFFGAVVQLHLKFLGLNGRKFVNLSRAGPLNLDALGESR